MKTIYISTLCVYFVTLINGYELPNFIKPCSRSDPDFNACAETVAQTALKKFAKGIPDLGVPSMDPAKLDTIKIDIPGLKVVYENTVMTGIGNGKIENLKVNLKKNLMKFDFFGNVTLKGKYDVRGRVLILPVVGDGDYTNIIKNLRLKIKYNLVKMPSPKGFEYWQISLAKRTFTVGGAYFDFKNLFGGNRLLGDTTLRFLNENWEAIMNDIAPTAIDQIVSVSTAAANTFYEKFPADVLLLP